MCGNGESIKLLSEWLHLWHEKDSQSSKKATCGDKCTMQDSDNGFYESDSDSDSNEGSDLKNVMLVTGPVGVCACFISTPICVDFVLEILIIFWFLYVTMAQNYHTF